MKTHIESVPTPAQKILTDMNQDRLYTNKEISKIFSVSHMGGMRRSLKNNCLILIHKTSNGVYDDQWRGNTLHYVGMGLTGDQELLTRQNAVLRYHAGLSVTVLLFESATSNLYRLLGEVELAGSPYISRQSDANGEDRKVWVFPLRLIIDNKVQTC